jgi:hypothetical protein
MSAVSRTKLRTLLHALGEERHFALVEDVPIQPRLARNHCRSGTQSDPCISSFTTSIMITTSNSPVKRERAAQSIARCFTATMACSELARVSVRAYRPAKFHENNSELKAEWERLRSGEIDFAVEKLRLSACLIRSVRG